ncbi:LacI family DNA-binding transcriptional regulator [Pseudogracilibacillus auburnensis]|uniref:LacI family DNA-binding transcriptional regulator n=1 Tax=Pseudogracilibacillus auburnensis TaxID=1494959 RepID=UPI001A96329B|nr:LacI family DNA-binding transcriptional regulator [Pseudogracilibacillus auburnensis]MBO1005809.1 LacI family DNA-binding transcriptional regulator [Pseudogracilibacillus auburnensis]
MKKATIEDVARKANVSVATVSRVINAQGGVRKSTEEKIVQAIKELNYVRNAVARSMVRKETKTIAVIVPDICNPFFSEVVAGVERKAIAKDYFTMVSSSNESKINERKLIQHIIERGVDGVVVTTADESGEQLKPLFDLKVPIVAVDRVIKNYQVDTVIIGNREGAYEAVRHLIHEGHKDISIIRGPQNTTPGYERYNGYVQAMKEFGLDIREEFIGDGDFREDSGYEIAKKFSQLDTPPTAIFSSNNLMSIGALKAIQEMNWKLGEEISFLGFDDIEIATFTRPQITTVSRPMRQLGEVAFQLLYDQLMEENIKERKSREIILTPHLNIRESCKRKIVL